MNGIYIHENLDSDQLATYQVYGFADVLSPLRLKGAAASPGNPSAVVSGKVRSMGAKLSIQTILPLRVGEGGKGLNGAV